MNFKDKRTLGRTRLSVSRMGLASGFGLPERAVIRAFEEFGINYFFWAEMRGGGMRDALKKLCRGSRDKLIVSCLSYDHTGLLIKWSVERMMKKINADYIDILTLGWYNYYPSRRVLDAALSLSEEKKIRCIGMTGHNRRFFGKLLKEGGFPVDVITFRYNAAHPGAEEDILPYAQDDPALRPGLAVYTATSWGKLLRKKNLPEGEKPLGPADCYRFVLSQSRVDLCLTGPKTEKEMEENFSALELGPLGPQDMERTRRIGRYIRGK